MSVLVQSLINNHHHPHSAYFASNSTRRLHANPAPTKQARQATSKVNNETEQTNDHVPHGVVNSMKQRLLDKVNESLLLNNNTVSIRHALSKPLSNENLLQTKPAASSLKHATRLSRSQDNLTHHHSSNTPPAQHLVNEQLASYIQPKHDVIIVESTTNENDHDEDVSEKLQAGQKASLHRQSYTELLVDEAPKPGTVTTVKNMFERQIRLSRYDADKLLNTSTPGSSRMSSQHREVASPIRSRSVSPNDLTLRQRRTIVSIPIVPLTSTTLSLPTAASYPDLVISHTPPTDTTKSATEQVPHEPVVQGSTKEKKISIPIRHSTPHEQMPLSVVIADESVSNLTDQYQPHLLLPSTTSSAAETVECQPLDFKSRLALFNRTNTNKSNDISIPIKKHSNPATHSSSSSSSTSTNVVPKAVIHPPVHAVQEEKKEAVVAETMHHQLLTSISRSVINAAKAVTFFGGNRFNGTTASSLPSCIPAPPPPVLSSAQTNGKNEHSCQSTSADALRAPDVIGGNVKLNKSSIFSGARKDARVQFIDNVDTFEYPSFEVAMAELGSTGSDNDHEMDDDEDAQSNDSNGDRDAQGRANDQHEEFTATMNGYNRDTNDDELEQLARINATYNTNNLVEKPLKPKGTLHTFRPTHLDQYELGTQHGSLSTAKPSDTSSSTISYSILARQKLVSSSDIPSKTVSNHPILKYSQKPIFDMANNIQWSSMSTTTDLLF